MEARMKECISFDSHKRYTLAEHEDMVTGRTQQHRIEHGPGAIRTYLSRYSTGLEVAVEATGNWYWIVTEIEQAGDVPLLVHPRKAKLMMGMINKTDKLDVHGLNRLQRNGTLPTVWIPPGDLRDLREVTRVRMLLGRHRTRLKNRITATLAKYALGVTEVTDAYTAKARPLLKKQLQRLPPHTQWAATLMLEQLDFVQKQIAQQEERLKAVLAVTPAMELLISLPGIGLILAAVLALEIGDITRFACPERLASYAGTTPRVHASGDKVRYGRLRSDVNRYLRWAFVEAGNSVALNYTRCPDRHVSQLYSRVRGRRGHSKAIGAVARHLAEAAFWVLSKKEPYRDPVLKKESIQGGVSAIMS
jgi:transposase